MSDPYWTLWATPTRTNHRTALEEYFRLEYPGGDGSALLAGVPARTEARRAEAPPALRAPRRAGARTHAATITPDRTCPNSP